MKNISKKDVAAVLIFIALIIGFIFLIKGITDKGSDREKKIIEEAVKNAALTCYVVEGTYPDDVQYLRDNYNLAYNKDKYFVEFRQKPFASNVMPNIIVQEIGGESQ
jgi:hypothetical protein